MYQPQQPMTTKYYLISSKYPSDLSSSHRAAWLLKISTSLKCSTNFPCVPKDMQDGAGLVCSFIWAKLLPVASVFSDPCEVDTQRCLTIFLTWFWVAGVLSVPLATQGKAETSSSSNSTHQRPGWNSHKISSNMGVDQSDIGKYHTE